MKTVNFNSILSATFIPLIGQLDVMHLISKQLVVTKPIITKPIITKPIITKSIITGMAIRYVKVV
jgi:hypothetical protein